MPNTNKTRAIKLYWAFTAGMAMCIVFNTIYYTCNSRPLTWSLLRVPAEWVCLLTVFVILSWQSAPTNIRPFTMHKLM